MDLRCPKCSEPIENDYLHDIAEEHGKTYQEVRDDFYMRGCEAVDANHGDLGFNPAYSAIYDFMGDDTDGAISMIEDMEYMGML